MSVAGMISPEWTFTQRPLRTTRSAGLRPVATSTSTCHRVRPGCGLVETVFAYRHFIAPIQIFIQACPISRDFQKRLIRSFIVCAIIPLSYCALDTESHVHLHDRLPSRIVSAMPEERGGTGRTGRSTQVGQTCPWEDFMKKFVAALAAATIAASISFAANAQTYPERNITVVVPFSAGGPTDTVTRLVAEAMSKDLGQQVIVENVGGAGGTLGRGPRRPAPIRTATRFCCIISAWRPAPRSTASSPTTR
jgi:hypothetical protein